MTSPGLQIAQRREAAVLYRLRIMHRRHVAPRYRFVYRIFTVLFDIDQLGALHRSRRWFSHNRFNLMSLHDQDHGNREPGELRRWAEASCRSQGIELAGGRIRLLAQPRLLGWAFNPVSFWYCEHADGTLRAVIAEVRNTFGERHSYLLSSASVGDGSASAGLPLPYGELLEKEKCFHVSPLFDLKGRYFFTFDEPGEKLAVRLNETREGAPLIDTAMGGQARAFSDAQILRQVVAMPVQALKVLAAIHWQALKIWLRGARFHKKPDPPSAKLT